MTMMDRIPAASVRRYLGVAVLLALGSLPALAGEIRGTLRNQNDGTPIAGAEIVVVETGASARTAADGSFALAPVPAGTYTLEARLRGYAIQELPGVQVQEQGATEVGITLTPAPETVDEIVVTPSQYSLLNRAPENRQFLSRTQISQLPHFSDDLYRVLARLPGASGGDISAKFYIRGGEQDEVLALVDGLEVYEPFHLKDFQSVFSILDSEAMGGLDFSTGGFTAEYGDRMSGVIDISTITPEARSTEIGLSFVNARVLSQGTFRNGDAQWLVSARRGYLDIVLNAVDSENDFEPTYYDALAKVQWRLGDHTTLATNVLAAYDKVVFRNDDDGERADATYGNAYLWFNLKSELNSRLFAQTVLSGGHVDRDRSGGVDNSDAFSRVKDERNLDVFGLKQDWTYRLSDRNLLKAGFDVKSQRADYDYTSHQLIRDEIIVGSGPPIVIDKRSDVSPSGETYAAYVADRFRLLPKLTVELGARYDRQTVTEDDQVSPRVNLAYEVSDHTVIRAGWGHYYQSQRLNELQVEDGVDHFFPAQRAEHRLLSVEHSFGSGLNLRVELYQKKMTDVRPRFENLFDQIELFPEAEADRVRVAPDSAEATGAEIMLQQPAGERWTWWFSYAYAKAEDEIDGETVPRSWDQRHSVTFSVNYKLGEKWNLNVAGVYHSGWPTTAVSARWQRNPNGSIRIIPQLGPRNGENVPAYHHVDLRASRRVPTRRGEFTFFLEVINVYNRQNVCCADNFEFTLLPDGVVNVERSDDYWLPIIPSFGVTWKF